MSGVSSIESLKSQFSPRFTSVRQALRETTGTSRRSRRPGQHLSVSRLGTSGPERLRFTGRSTLLIHPVDPILESRRLSGVAASTSDFRDFEDETSGFPAGRKGFPTLWNPSPAPASGDDINLNSRTATSPPLGEGSASGVSHGTHGNAPQQTLGLAPLWQRMILAALWPEGFVGQAETAVKEFMAYAEMARLINLLPSCILVLIGAWVGAGHSLSVLLHTRVVVMALISMSIAVASCVVNDYFDYATGVDAINAPDKPLPSGVVPPDGALLFAFILYMWVLIAGCLLEPPLLRIIVAASAGLTLLYTPMLKKVTFVKNATVAAIIAMSPAAGAIAAGTGSGGLWSVAPVCVFIYMAIVYREILMDITDAEGDAAAGVYTLPVVLGKRAAMALGLFLFGGATLLSGAAVWFSGGMARLATALPLLQSWLRPLGVAFVGFITRPVFADAARVARGGMDTKQLQAAIDGMLKPLGLGLLYLAAVA